MIESIKPLYNRVLKPFARSHLMKNISPSFVTFLGLLMFIVSAYFVGIGSWRVAFFFGILGGLMDGLDGVLARENGKESKFGAILDSTVDRLTEIVWFTGLLYYYVNMQYGASVYFSIFIAMSGSICVSYVRARGEGAGVSYSGGILLRPERLIFLGILLIMGPEIMRWGLWVIATFAYITVIQRLVILKKMCK